MKSFGKWAISIMGGLTLMVSGRADNNIALSGDPYATVVTRNIFGLNPPPPPGPPVDATPPPKITPNGIMFLFGQLQVLFKVPGTPKPGLPTTDQSYILSEGQRQDDIEVMKIDEKNGIITFNNHGETQQLPLVVTQPSSSVTAAPVPSQTGGPSARFSPGLINPSSAANGGVRPSGTGGAANSNNGNAVNNGASNSGINLGNGAARNNTFNAVNQIPEGMTEEVQTVAIEANRELTRQQVDSGDLPPLPITDLTPSDAPENGSNSPTDPNHPK